MWEWTNENESSGEWVDKTDQYFTIESLKRIKSIFLKQIKEKPFDFHDALFGFEILLFIIFNKHF